MKEFFDALDGFLVEHGIRHFTARELAPVGRIAAAEGSPRLMPPPPELWGMCLPTLHVLEWLRAQLGGKKIRVTSGWRDRHYNRAVGGSPDSMHLQFNAADIQHETAPPSVVVRTLETSHLARWLGLGRYQTFTHVDSRGLFGRGEWARW